MVWCHCTQAEKALIVLPGVIVSLNEKHSLKVDANQELKLCSFGQLDTSNLSKPNATQ